VGVASAFVFSADGGKILLEPFGARRSRTRWLAGSQRYKNVRIGRASWRSAIALELAEQVIRRRMTLQLAGRLEAGVTKSLRAFIE
jgi:hypothetical protein